MTLRQHLTYEWLTLRQARWLPWLALSTVSITAALALIVGPAARDSWLLNDDDMWALAATMGGTLGWPAMYAYFLAILGVLVWRQDCGGESATVAYATFPTRWRTAATRSATLTLTSVVLSLSAFATSIAIYPLVTDMPPIDAHLALLAVKSGWATICGVCFAHLGALICVAARSALIGASLLIVIPWVLEPVLIELASRTPALSWLAEGFQFLPFRLASDTLGDTAFDSIGHDSFAQLSPATAALAALVLTGLAGAIVQWRYCTTDGGTTR